MLNNNIVREISVNSVQSILINADSEMGSNNVNNNNIGSGLAAVNEEELLYKIIREEIKSYTVPSLNKMMQQKIDNIFN